MEISKNAKKYIKLKKEYEDEEDVEKQDKIQTQLENLYFLLNDEEIAFLERKEII